MFDNDILYHQRPLIKYSFQNKTRFLSYTEFRKVFDIVNHFIIIIRTLGLVAGFRGKLMFVFLDGTLT